MTLTNSPQGSELGVVVTCPSGSAVTSKLTMVDWVGIVVDDHGGTNSEFVVPPSSAAIAFSQTGRYTVVANASTTAVDVVAPVGVDLEIVTLVPSNRLLRMCMVVGPEDVEANTKTAAEQILQYSPTGRYADYARIYLAIAELHSLREGADSLEGHAPPDFSQIADKLSGMSPAVTLVRPAWRYHAGYACGMARRFPAARAHLEALLLERPWNFWSDGAARLLEELNSP